MIHSCQINIDLVNLTKVETECNLHQLSLMWCNQNDRRNQGFLFSSLEMQQRTESDVDETETSLYCFRYWKKSCYCNMQISSSYHFWVMERPRSSCQSGEGEWIFVTADFSQCAVWNNWLAFFKNCYILSNLCGIISVIASISASNIDLSLV